MLMVDMEYAKKALAEARKALEAVEGEVNELKDRLQVLDEMAGEAHSDTRLADLYGECEGDSLETEVNSVDTALENFAKALDGYDKEEAEALKAEEDDDE